MELFLLSEEKIKIVLSREDLTKRHLTYRQLDYDDVRTRKMIWEIFDLAKDQTGFDAAREKVCIELFPKKSGGCEIYATKVKDEEKEKDYIFIPQSRDIMPAVERLENVPFDIFESENGNLYIKVRLSPSDILTSVLAEFGTLMEFENADAYIDFYTERKPHAKGKT